MKPLLILFCAVAAWGQGKTTPLVLPGTQSAKVTPQPEQDVTITIHLTVDQATALEKARVDNSDYIANPDGTMAAAPVFATIQDQLLAGIQEYFARLFRRYPTATVQAAQTSLQVSQDAIKNASKVIKK